MDNNNNNIDNSNSGSSNNNSSNNSLRHSGSAEYSCKVVLVGDAGVGKSCFLQKYVDSTYHEDHVVTIGVDFKSKIIERETETLKLNLWDTAGEDRFRATSSSIYGGADACILFYDTTDQSTLKNLFKWKTEIDKMNSNIIYIMVGTKCDLNEKRAVHVEAAQNVATQIQVQLFETSAKTGENVESAISTLADLLIEKQSANFRITPRGGKEETKPRKRFLKIIFKNLRIGKSK